MNVPPVLSLATDVERVDTVAQPLGKRCRCRGCDRPATAVAISASVASYPVT
jgi:hypothetical protein